MYNLIIFVFFTFLSKATFAYSIEDESKLQRDLLNGYNVNVRPADQVFVQCALTINNLLSLDTVDQTLSVTGSLAVIWNDHRLSWNMSQYGNVSGVYFKSDQKWRPMLVLKNSVTGIEVIGDNGNQKSIPMRASSPGSLFWLAPAYFQSHCSVDISTFPFDTQTCEIVISTWMFSTGTIKLSNYAEKIGTYRLDQNGEYDVVHTYTRLDVDPFFGFSLEYLVFGIELRRKYSYYLINIVLPVFFMQLLGLVVFAVPTDSGEKLSFSLTLLLSLTVMMTLVAEKIPPTSLQIPTLSVYMLGGTIISILELIMTVCILQLKHNQNRGDQMSKKMKKFANCLAILVCIQKNKVESMKGSLQKSDNISSYVKVEEVTNKEMRGKSVPETTEDDVLQTDSYTYEDITLMMDKFSVVLFGCLTLIFTITMLFMII